MRRKTPYSREADGWGPPVGAARRTRSGRARWADEWGPPVSAEWGEERHAGLGLVSWASVEKERGYSPAQRKKIEKEREDGPVLGVGPVVL